MQMLAFGFPGLPEILVIGALIMILWGWKNLPQVGSAMGKGIQNFKKALKTEDDEKEVDITPERPQLEEGDPEEGEFAEEEAELASKRGEKSSG